MAEVEAQNHHEGEMLPFLPSLESRVQEKHQMFHNAVYCNTFVAIRSPAVTGQA